VARFYPLFSPHGSAKMNQMLAHESYHMHQWLIKAVNRDIVTISLDTGWLQLSRAIMRVGEWLQQIAI
jgi:hypothetical protein